MYSQPLQHTQQVIDLQLWVVLQHEPNMQPTLQAGLPLCPFASQQDPHLAGPCRHCCIPCLAISWLCIIALQWNNAQPLTNTSLCNNFCKISCQLSLVLRSAAVEKGVQMEGTGYNTLPSNLDL